MTRLLIIVPAHNEAKFIARVVASIKVLGHRVVVIDDGSQDDTADLARNAGAEVISTGRKSGKGNALRLGFVYALKQDIDAVITLDGDGQHDSADIKHFLNRYEAAHAQVINGNRMHDPKGMPLIRLITNKFMSWIISSICQQRIIDSQCGFRFMTKDVLKQVKLECTDFEIETELLIQANKKGFRIDNAPITTIYRDEKSKIRPLRDTWRFIVYLFKESTRR